MIMRLGQAIPMGKEKSHIVELAEKAPVIDQTPADSGSNHEEIIEGFEFPWPGLSLAILLLLLPIPRLLSPPSISSTADWGHFPVVRPTHCRRGHDGIPRANPVLLFECRCLADRGRRICAIPADDELQSVELYLLLPMHRLNTRFSSEEVAAFATLDEAAQKCHGKQATYCKGAAISHSKVAPFPAAAASEAMHRSIAESAGLAMTRGGSFKVLEGRRVQDDVRGPVRGFHMCRSKSWMPKLETVNEYAVVS
ncbi:hypothetical protein L7F22_012167 [Adiantum nelumboides]|nr:hypothetical protein [Adiantum nelumboides]